MKRVHDAHAEDERWCFLPGARASQSLHLARRVTRLMPTNDSEPHPPSNSPSSISRPRKKSEAGRLEVMRRGWYGASGGAGTIRRMRATGSPVHYTSAGHMSDVFFAEHCLPVSAQSFSVQIRPFRVCSLGFSGRGGSQDLLLAGSQIRFDALKLPFFHFRILFNIFLFSLSITKCAKKSLLLLVLSATHYIDAHEPFWLLCFSDLNNTASPCCP